MTELPPEVARLLEATNTEDRAAFLDAFTDDGAVDDWGRRFAGRDRIAEWDAGENIGVHSRIEATSVRRTGDTVEFGVQVSGDGYNGGGTFTAELRDGKVALLQIRG
ncbi:nuclear transport factor 2 family protein [Blastococcus sp. CT_GayMR16]|uniref:nuclear transport factor 2 family protein n=1 Tax=Blastococcus sp. CT_GayMR16 TaxID=2559607 RepID=UPI0010746BA3|nr:nuclear transport factor 2 family protein [Blastococcus sp. CT_GayMR16]TFV88783.1 nuclear transport factor 2 family protein [Blastococcus sp. CT_GayMR16]